MAIRLTFLVASCATALPACAEVIYELIGADGEVTYSSQPVANARHSEAIDITTLSPEQRRATLLLRQHYIDIAPAPLPQSINPTHQVLHYASVTC